LHASERRTRCHVGLCQVRYWATRDSRARWQRRRDWLCMERARYCTLMDTSYLCEPCKSVCGQRRFNGDGTRDARWPSLCDSGNVLRVADDAARTAISYLNTTEQVRSGLAAFEAVWTAQ
jgi:hypothetical protein